MCSQIIKTEHSSPWRKKQITYHQFESKLSLINTNCLFNSSVVRAEMLFRSFLTEEFKEASRKPSCAVAVTGFAFQYPKWLSAAIRLYLYWTPAENIDLCWFHHFSHHKASRFKQPSVALYWILIVTTGELTDWEYKSITLWENNQLLSLYTSY